MLANRAFLALIEGYSLDWDTGIPSHAVQFLSLTGSAPPTVPSVAVSRSTPAACPPH
jgi:hypothetical protein